PPQNSSAPAEAAEERDRPTDAISTPEPALQPPHFTSTEASEPEPPLAAQSNTAAADSFVAAEPANVPEFATASIPQTEDAFVAPIPAELAPVEAQPEPSPGFK